jgi:RimJ/RimL family protein N-acetyltransferase
MSVRRRPTVSVRPATLDDSGRLLDWANDPVTRAASFRPDRIEPAAHERWLADRLASPTCRLMIGSEGSTRVGQIRFEMGLDGSAEIGISLAPTARGRGIGAALLAAGLTAVRGDRTFRRHSLRASEWTTRPRSRSSSRPDSTGVGRPTVKAFRASCSSWRHERQR